MTTTTSDSKDSRRLSGSVPPDSTRTLTWTLDDDATVEQVALTIYPGPQLDLRLKPFARVEGPSGQRERNLVGFADESEAKQYIDGNDERLIYPVSQPVERDDVVGIEVENVDPDHEYSFACDLTVDYAGGVKRTITSFFGGLI